MGLIKALKASNVDYTLQMISVLPAVVLRDVAGDETGDVTKPEIVPSVVPRLRTERSTILKMITRYVCLLRPGRRGGGGIN